MITTVCSSVEELVREMRSWSRDNPGTVWMISDDPMNRRLGFQSGERCYCIPLTRLNGSGFQCLFTSVESRTALARVLSV
jgi:hypothetical protein